jgi:hypothetical protein
MSLVQKTQTQCWRVPEQKISQRPFAKMERKQVRKKLWLT